ncbi:ribonuclease HI [Actinomadura logoneensis]|nr:RNase H family protein [Actinomadura logoneensis]
MPLSLHRFDEELRALSTELAARAQSVRAGATRAYGCHVCKVVRQALGLAFTAARHGDEEWAGLLIGEAVYYAEHGGHLADCPQGPVAPPKRRPPLEVHRSLTEWAGASLPLVAATDASWWKNVTGVGYVVSDGRWGMRGHKGSGRPLAGADPVVIGELHAVALLLEHADADVVLVDSMAALKFLRSWQSSGTAPMPCGYDARPTATEPAALVRLAERVAERPDLRFEHVKAHRGHPLNETADSLASIARRRATRRFDAVARAEGLVQAFLAAWHDQDDPHALAA